MIMITGAGGVLGMALLNELKNCSEEVVALSSKDVDLLDPEKTLEFFRSAKPRVIYHAAAKVHGLMGNRRFPASMYTDNIRINTSIIDAAHKCGCEKIVTISSVAVYSTQAKMPVSETSIWDGPPHSSEAAYGHAKRGMLAQLEAYATQYGLNFAYAIMTNLYGPHDRFDPEHGHVVPSLIAKFHKAAVSGGNVEVWGSGAAERDFMYCEDAARALRLIGEQHSGPVNVAAGKTFKIREIVEMLRATSGVEDVVWDPTKPNGQIQRQYDISILDKLGFKTRVPTHEGLGRTYKWYSDAFPNVRS